MDDGGGDDMSAFDRDAWCAKALPHLWPEAVRIREAATAAGLRCVPAIGGGDGDAIEMYLTFYRDFTVIGCASREDADVGWAWFLEGGGQSDENDADALIEAVRMSAAVTT